MDPTLTDLDARIAALRKQRQVAKVKSDLLAKRDKLQAKIDEINEQIKVCDSVE